MRRSDFSGASLKDADLVSVDLRESNFDKADLSGADLQGANLWRSDLRQASTGGMTVSDRTIVESGLHATPEWAAAHHAKFVSVKVVPAVVPAPAPLFYDEKPSPSSKSVVPPTAPEVKAVADLTVPVKDAVPDIPAARAVDTPSRPINAGSNAEIQLPAELIKPDVQAWNRLRKEKIAQKAQLRSADLRYKKLAGADFSNVDLSGASFKSSDLSVSDMRGSILFKTNFREADLRKADFRNADLRGATLWRADTEGARFEGATVSGATILSDGTRASAAWAVEHQSIFSQESATPQ